MPDRPNKHFATRLQAMEAHLYDDAKTGKRGAIGTLRLTERHAREAIWLARALAALEIGRAFGLNPLELLVGFGL